MALTLRKFNKKAMDKLCKDKSFGSYARAIKWLIDTHEPRIKETEKLHAEIQRLKVQLNQLNADLHTIREFGKLINKLKI